MPQIYLNNWQTKTTAAVDSSTNYIPVPAEAIERLKAAGLPDISVADGLTVVRLTLANPTSGVFEILYCVGYQGQTLACNRGWENDAPARDWPAGTLMYLSQTAGDLAEMHVILTSHSKNIADLYKAGSGGGSTGGGSSSGGTKYTGQGPTLYSNGSAEAYLDLLPMVNMRCIFNWYPTYPSNGRALLVAPQNDDLYGGSLDIDLRVVIADDISTLALESKQFECWWNVPSRPEVADSGPQYVVDVQPGEYMLSLRKWPLGKATAVLTRIYSPSFPGQ